MIQLRSLAAYVARTPLHPQWLLGRRRAPESMRQATGLILDIGAADRWIEQHLSPQAQYIALDYPVTARNLYDARPDVFADAAHLPFCADRFDGVTCLEVLEHVPDPEMVVAEIARVLKPGGRAWISMPFLYPLHDAPFDFQRYTEYGLRRDAQRAGLQITTLRKSGHAIRTAGLLTCLAIAGAAHAKRDVVAVLLLPLAILMVLFTNITAFVLSLLWPDWNHLAMGHELEVRKP